ncbi:MAG: 4-(cytidine 5'-diphospho)-2-C-methyl-D-erythritol kinase [Actinobacteria bacterium]|nr:4-(cytidine 5'-diphospho)-2-C-methyl-D-erythritol kinase [Actinomycetota bacterium]
MRARRAVAREAHAKINACLRVIGRREDGYHEIQSLVLPIDLADTVTARAAAGLKVEVRGESELVDAISAGGMNLSLVAALSIAEACGAASPGAAIEIVKRIPVAAGLGGGSADAAATLHVLNELWGCGLELEVLLGLGERIGSDLPALLLEGPVVIRGRGEHVDRIAAQPTFWAVKPFDFPTRSPDAYRWWDEDGAETGPDTGVLYAAVEAGSFEILGASIFNDLEGPVSRRHPEVAEAKQAFLEAGALGAVMSGSGPTVAALATHPMQAEHLATAVPGAFVALGLAGQG